VPEINAGRVLSEYGEFHPTPEFLEILLEHDVEFTLGTDSHEPDEIAARKERIETFVATHGIDPVTVHE
jgi:histidinol-phosphatase (PHP family)